jgi:hypothetical protein
LDCDNNNGRGRLLKKCEVRGAGNKPDSIQVAFLPRVGVTVKNPVTEIKHKYRREMKQNTTASRHIKSVPHFF